MGMVIIIVIGIIITLLQHRAARLVNRAARPSLRCARRDGAPARQTDAGPA